MKIGEWIDKHWNEIIMYGYLIILIVVIILGIVCVVGRIVTVINSDIPAWLKWQLLTR